MGRGYSGAGGKGGGLFNKSDLPELQGTPRQVAWANDIRNDIVEWLQKGARGEGESVPPTYLLESYMDRYPVIRFLEKEVHGEANLRRLLTNARTGKYSFDGRGTEQGSWEGFNKFFGKLFDKFIRSVTKVSDWIDHRTGRRDLW